MKNFYLSIIIALSLNVTTYAQTHYIDNSFDSCLQGNNYTQIGTNKCLSLALINWDKQLNTVYKELRGSISEENKVLLKTSQLNWLKYCDSEFLFIEAQVKGMEGSMYPTMILRNKLRVLKDRVLELEAYLRFYDTMR